MDEKSSSSAARIRVRPARYRGQHVARDSLFINIARFLWALDIGHAIEDGKEVPIDTMATQGTANVFTGANTMTFTTSGGTASTLNYYEVNCVEFIYLFHCWQAHSSAVIMVNINIL